jgi:hypothetical protein
MRLARPIHHEVGPDERLRTPAWVRSSKSLASWRSWSWALGSPCRRHADPLDARPRPRRAVAYAEPGFQWLLRMAVMVTVPKTPAEVKGSFFEKVSAAWRSATLTM